VSNDRFRSHPTFRLSSSPSSCACSRLSSAPRCSVPPPYWPMSRAGSVWGGPWRPTKPRPGPADTQREPWRGAPSREGYGLTHRNGNRSGGPGVAAPEERGPLAPWRAVGTGSGGHLGHHLTTTSPPPHHGPAATPRAPGRAPARRPPGTAKRP